MTQVTMRAGIAQQVPGGVAPRPLGILEGPWKQQVWMRGKSLDDRHSSCKLVQRFLRDWGLKSGAWSLEPSRGQEVIDFGMDTSTNWLLRGCSIVSKDPGIQVSQACQVSSQLKNWG